MDTGLVIFSLKKKKKNATTKFHVLFRWSLDHEFQLTQRETIVDLIIFARNNR